MQTYFDCLPCFLNQALRACRFMDLNDRVTKQVLDAVAGLMPRIPLDNSPPETARQVYRIIREISGNPDPYKQIKEDNTARAMAQYPVLKRMVAASNDRLDVAIKIAAAGNVIDCGVDSEYVIEEEIQNILDLDFAIFDGTAFRRCLEEADHVLYIGDNAGECVFDRVLIEELKKPVVYVVRGHPVINDATVEDAVAAGIDQVAEVVSSGTDAPGAVLNNCNEEFRRLFQKPWLKISKGQGNYEALSGLEIPLFFLLKAKCSVIARDLNVPEGQLVFKGTNSESRVRNRSKVMQV